MKTAPTKPAKRGTTTSTNSHEPLERASIVIEINDQIYSEAKMLAETLGETFDAFLERAIRMKCFEIVRANPPTTTSTKPAAPGREFKLTKSQAQSIRRLARQLDLTPDNLVSRFIDLQIRYTDVYLAENCEALEDCCYDDFNCTAAMNAMSLDEIQRIEDASGEACQRVLYKIDCAKRGLQCQ